MSPVLGLDDGNLTHAEGRYGMHTASRAYAADFVGVHEDSFAGLADELHVVENREVVSVLELGPDALLGVRDLEESGGVGGGDCAAGDGGDEAGAEEDVEDGEVLGGMGDGDAGAAGAKRVVDERAEVVRQRHPSLLFAAVYAHLCLLFASVYALFTVPAHLRRDPRRHLIRRRALPERLHKLPLRVHQIHKDRVVDQIVPLRVRVGRRRKVHPVRLARPLDRLVRPHQPDECRMKVG